MLLITKYKQDLCFIVFVSVTQFLHNRTPDSLENFIANSKNYLKTYFNLADNANK